MESIGSVSISPRMNLDEHVEEIFNDVGKITDTGNDIEDDMTSAVNSYIQKHIYPLLKDFDENLDHITETDNAKAQDQREEQIENLVHVPRLKAQDQSNRRIQNIPPPSIDIERDQPELHHQRENGSDSQSYLPDPRLKAQDQHNMQNQNIPALSIEPYQPELQHQREAGISKRTQKSNNLLITVADLPSSPAPQSKADETNIEYYIIQLDNPVGNHRYTFAKSANCVLKSLDLRGRLASSNDVGGKVKFVELGKYTSGKIVSFVHGKIRAEHEMYHWNALPTPNPPPRDQQFRLPFLRRQPKGNISIGTGTKRADPPYIENPNMGIAPLLHRYASKSVWAGPTIPLHKDHPFKELEVIYQHPDASKSYSDFDLLQRVIRTFSPIIVNGEWKNMINSSEEIAQVLQELTSVYESMYSSVIDPPSLPKPVVPSEKPQLRKKRKQPARSDKNIDRNPTASTDLSLLQIPESANNFVPEAVTYPAKPPLARSTKGKTVRRKSSSDSDSESTCLDASSELDKNIDRNPTASTDLSLLQIPESANNFVPEAVTYPAKPPLPPPTKRKPVRRITLSDSDYEPTCLDAPSELDLSETDTSPNSVCPLSSVPLLNPPQKDHPSNKRDNAEACMSPASNLSKKKVASQKANSAPSALIEHRNHGKNHSLPDPESDADGPSIVPSNAFYANPPSRFPQNEDATKRTPQAQRTCHASREDNQDANLTETDSDAPNITSANKGCNTNSIQTLQAKASMPGPSHVSRNKNPPTKLPTKKSTPQNAHVSVPPQLKFPKNKGAPKRASQTQPARHAALDDDRDYNVTETNSGAPNITSANKGSGQTLQAAGSIPRHVSRKKVLTIKLPTTKSTPQRKKKDVSETEYESSSSECSRCTKCSGTTDSSSGDTCSKGSKCSERNEPRKPTTRSVATRVVQAIFKGRSSKENPKRKPTTPKPTLKKMVVNDSNENQIFKLDDKLGLDINKAGELAAALHKSTSKAILIRVAMWVHPDMVNFDWANSKGTIATKQIQKNLSKSLTSTEFKETFPNAPDMPNNTQLIQALKNFKHDRKKCTNVRKPRYEDQFATYYGFFIELAEVE